MDRNIPHVLDVFTSSPGARRRARATIISKEKDDFQKNPGSDSAVSVGSSDEEDEEQRNISRYFDYLNEDDLGGGGSSQRRKKKKKQGRESRDTSVRDSSCNNNINNNGLVKTGEDGDSKSKGGTNLASKNEKNKQSSGEGGKERTTRKGEYEKDIRHIERHLSMKKTIRKKIMRDLQQAFVEDPKDLQQDPKGLTEEKKNNIDINNLTFSKNRLSKSEHNFLDMLKEVQPKERKGLRALMDFRKPTPASTDPEEKATEKKTEDCKQKVNEDGKPSGAQKPINDVVAKTIRTVEQPSSTVTKTNDQIRDDDSGHGSPTRESGVPRRCRSRDDLLDGSTTDHCKEGGKKQSFWKRITGKGKAKR